MKIAVISDIHSNLEAFEAVLAEIKKRGIAKILCVGDIVGYGANPNECVEIVRKLKILSVQGNHDFCCINFDGIDDFNEIAQEAVRWTHNSLSAENMDFLKSLPKTMVEEGVFFAHGSPRDPLHEYVYYDFSDEDAKEFFGIARTGKIALGHTHIPFVKRFGSRLILNPGGVGQPRDRNPKASFAVLDTETGNAEILRVDYDIKKAAGKIIGAGLPKHLADRIYLGR